ncbi:syntaxin-17-like [Tropilaelaps mercedesae]|uniref:Syntaxin-17-like n=1 Tax=Tropilaelaps mercedesae TaxID=418985 RepID=A0A1V9XZK7_9ACAR|nr:syntaxin-17-like [Tropilaelaps mercedesae]
MMESYDDEPKCWRSSKKLPFKQVYFGLKQIVRDGVPQHLQRLHEALELTNCLPPASEVTWDHEVPLCRSRIQQALSMLMQDLRSLEDMQVTVRDEEMIKFKELASPCCEAVNNAIRDAKQGTIIRCII